LLKIKEEKQPTNKQLCLVDQFKFIFLVKDSFKKKDMPQKDFLEDLGLLIVKNNLPMQIVKSMWLKHLILCLCPK
jgi:hypothetical protein